MTKLKTLFSCSGILLLALLVSCESTTETASQVPGIDVSMMDTTVSPSDDFFKYVNGNWLKNAEIPSDRGRWNSFDEVRDVNSKTVLDVLEKAAKSGKYEATSDQMKAADFYSVGMDSLLAEKVGLNPIKPKLQEISAIENIAGVQKYLAAQEVYGGGAFFNFFVTPDLKNSKEMAAYLSQGGLGLPDRDYYTKTDEKSEDIREKYLAHITKMLQFLGDSEEKARAQAERIMELETRMAEASMTNVEKRNTPALYNKMSLNELSERVPSIDWPVYLADMGVQNIDTLIVMQPKFMDEYERIVNEVPLAICKEYLRWDCLNRAANYLNYDLVRADFDFYSQELRGVEEMRPRWKRVIGMTSGVLGEAIGKLYVEEVFPPEAKQKATAMVENIMEVFAERIKALDWMTDSTKVRALEKLDKMSVKIGYPDKWIDYSTMEISKDPEKSSYYDNVVAARIFDFQYELNKLGKPVDNSEWGMTPQTVNAGYHPVYNSITFPAAILQPPFYNYMADEAVNYGGIGAAIGHEISHCFDDSGSRFDADGNLNNWWTDADAENFKERTNKLVAQFDAYEPIDSVFVNGEFTLGENIGDLGGIYATYYGLQKHLSQNGNPGLIDGFTPEQRFFISWGTIWRAKYKDDNLRTLINTDPHSPGMYRANGPLSNMPEFYEAFDVKEGDAMWRAADDRVVIW
ncbi:putative endopeptidase [Reichenbachiella faecimaris]|uniref:Putative endopeptidase n=1 Tax=Reichenbachiella faecimaris TaxID=692418 RepID=A0A1W2G8H3_REIFA|nr:M13 family metallopeptidase [Reichenbachiella faecimaris]SMD32732.1 putative endopeptidase [Reichenbachiella faecimaris]